MENYRRTFNGAMQLTRVVGWIALAFSLSFGAWNLLHRFDPEFRSPYDEHSHFDFWWKIYQKHHFPEVYEKIDKESLIIWECSNDKIKIAERPCPTASGPSQHENTASNYQPTFYLATALLSKAINLLYPTENLFHLAKYSTLIWGIICLAAIAAVSLQLKTPPILSAIVVFASAQAPSYVFAAITFNQELFVLLCSLLGFSLYLHYQDTESIHKFSLISGIFAALCLSIKPTALLLPVTIVVAELLSPKRAKKARVARVSYFSIICLGVYGIASHIGNILRGVNPSDGKMRDYILAKRSGQTIEWTDYIEMIWTHFIRSTAAFRWKKLIDLDLPLLFMYFHKYLIIMTAAAMIYIVLCKYTRTKPAISSRLMIGIMASFVALPLALAIYLSFSDFPFFFQARYYTAYTITAIIFSTALLTDLARWASATLVKNGIPKGALNAT